jgi:hypothetical protein
MRVLGFRDLTEGGQTGCSKKTANEAAGERKPEAYPLGRTVRRIRSTTSVRAAESVRRPGPVEDFLEPRTKIGTRRVLARWGWAGGIGAFFSSLRGGV